MVGAVVRLIVFVPVFSLVLWMNIALAMQDGPKHPLRIPYAILAFLLIVPIGTCFYSMALHVWRRFGKSVGRGA